MIALELSPAQLEQGFNEAINEILNDPELLTAIHEAIASRVHSIVLQNFGQSGIDRPSAWSPLSARYAKRVKRSYATLELTGELKRSVRSESSPSEAVIWQDDSVPYGAAHQFGSDKLPARPYFPIIGDSVSAYTIQQIEEVVEETITEFLSSRYDR